MGLPVTDNFTATKQQTEAVCIFLMYAAGNTFGIFFLVGAAT